DFARDVQEPDTAIKRAIRRAIKGAETAALPTTDLGPSPKDLVKNEFGGLRVPRISPEDIKNFGKNIGYNLSHFGVGIVPFAIAAQQNDIKSIPNDPVFGLDVGSYSAGTLAAAEASGLWDAAVAAAHAVGRGAPALSVLSTGAGAGSATTLGILGSPWVTVPAVGYGIYASEQIKQQQYEPMRKRWFEYKNQKDRYNKEHNIEPSIWEELSDAWTGSTVLGQFEFRP
ncbi:hypothetical protein EBU91_02880, partial [bacterium]|nr:hypothetical protein [bacterium]